MTTAIKSSQESATIQRKLGKYSSDEQNDLPIGKDYNVNNNDDNEIVSRVVSSRLKCSTISKVLPASRSPVKLPVASRVESRSESTCQQGENLTAIQVRQPSRLARPATVRGRPTSLTLKTAGQTNTSLSSTKQLCSSILPKLSSSSLQIVPSKQRLASHRVGTVVNPIPNKTTTTPAIATHVQGTIKRRPTQGTSSSNPTYSSSSGLPAPTSCESRYLSGRLKNLVAVVHPQHLQRVNSSAITKPATANNTKISATACSLSASNSNEATTVDLRSTIGHLFKHESGKVSSNHKDVSVGKTRKKEGPQTRCDSKQARGRRIIASLTKSSNSTKITKAKTNELVKANNTDEEGQFSQSNINSSATEASNLTSVESSDDESPITLDGDQANNQQPQPLGYHCVAKDDKQSTITTGKHSTRPQEKTSNKMSSPQADNQKQDEQRKSNNCYKHDAFKSALTKPPAILFRHNLNSHAISDRLLSKPMGQQVSLLMLDVGLTPITKGNGSQQPEHQGRKSSLVHHRLHATASGTHVTNLEPHFNDNHVGPFNHDKRFFNRADYQDHEQYNNYYSLQPVDDLLRPQVCPPNHDRTAPRSISLPCSPRTRRLRGAFNHPGANRNLTHHQGRFPDQSNHSRPLDAFQGKAFLSGDCFRHQNQSSSFCDNLDSISIASSSCSSLNQCPPALALTNQLHDDLIKARMNSVQAEATDGKDDLIVLKNSAQNVVGQIDVRTLDTKHSASFKSDPSVAIMDHPGMIDREIECKLLSELKHNDTVTESHENQLGTKTSGHTRGERPRPDPLLRGHQQARSHSISGQEYHLNGEFQRIKQSYYAQQGHYNLPPHDGSPNVKQVQRVTSPYQQQQQQAQQNVLGRSPSPVSHESQTHYGSLQRDGTYKYSVDTQSVRSHLDYTNNGYSDYQQQRNMQHLIQQQNQHQLHQYQQQQQSHHHYASGYVLAPPPMNTIVNQSGDQDMAAAAMGPSPGQYSPMRTLTNSPIASFSSYSAPNQSIIDRAIAQVSNSPLRRIGLNTTSNNGASSCMLNNLNNSQPPMRAGHSSISLASSSFIIEDKLQNEIKKLHSELKSEKEKNEALNSQLNINSSLMAAFEQSLTTLNTRLRQLTTLNEKKDKEIEELRGQLRSTTLIDFSEKRSSLNNDIANIDLNSDNSVISSEKDSNSEKNLKKMVEDLRRQLIEKDRLLTDTRLEALSAAHQLEQLESKMNGEHSLLINEDDLDEGVMVVNHSPSDSEAITDSAQFNDINYHSNQLKSSCQRGNIEQTSFNSDANNTRNDVTSNQDGSIESNHQADDQSNNSSDYSSGPRDKDDMNQGLIKQFNYQDNSGTMNKLIDSLLS